MSTNGHNEVLMANGKAQIKKGTKESDRRAEISAQRDTDRQRTSKVNHGLRKCKKAKWRQ